MQDFSAIPEAPLPGKKSRVETHEREAKPKHPRDGGDESELFFDEAKVPVEVIVVPNPSERMKRAIDTERGRRLYSQRIGTVEPVFGNLRHNQRLARLNLRGREKVNAQWYGYRTRKD